MDRESSGGRDISGFLYALIVAKTGNPNIIELLTAALDLSQKSRACCA